MRPAELVRALASQGMELLEDIASGALARADLGQSSSVAGMWEKMAHVYFGPTRQRKLQAAAVAAGRGLPVAALERIEKRLRDLLTGADVTREELRVELCGLRGTVDEIDRAAAAVVREHNRTVKVANAKAYGKRALRGGKNTDGLGNRTFTVTGPERMIEAMLSPVREAARKLRRDNPDLHYEQAMFDAFTASQGGDGVQPVAPIPYVVVPLPEWAKVLRHEGDDTVFGLTDGTTMTGKELVEQVTAEYHIAGIYDPVEGPVNSYRSQRTASPKQRMMVATESLVCEAMCDTPADQCEVHHIDAWEQGGETNVATLTMLCRKHNGLNDDNPNAPPRNGRVERHPGGVLFHPPDGSPPKANPHPLRKYSARGLQTDA
ncbi:MAG: HNH endonuclease signature motif containing protein [Corynebacterium sp.]|uniref:HNH endonuclease signature motif containing protein n=1 Tax=Corynebacterium sp. TaxID=1720 RepID=UPI0026E09E5A|nr:HNH endonuclease signature motif containing protein [Corynebacterium sp.]MDO5669602.1 HNH endonuclease signature motif containing protein [Corynebacterium sp.]